MTAVHVRILHGEPGEAAGLLEQTLTDARRSLAGRHELSFRQAGADDVRVIPAPRDRTPFGTRVKALAAEAQAAGAGGLVILGSGAIPLASKDDLATFVSAAGGPAGHALANNRYSADVIAIAGLGGLDGIPDDLATDNALPRWLGERGGHVVGDLRDRWHLGIDLDSPLDLVLVDRSAVAATEWAARVCERIDAVAAVAADERAELLVAGRTSAATLAHLEEHAAARVRALVEERGFRTAPRQQRAPRSVIGTALDVGGPGTLGRLLASFGDAAVLDSRVLLAHRLGRDEARWPSPEDRFASDLLLPERIRHPWLRALTAAATRGPIPILLGGHTLVGPGLRLIIGARDPAVNG